MPRGGTNWEELSHDAREYAAMSLTSLLEELELPRNGSETNIDRVCDKIRDRIVLDALKNYVPLQQYSSNFRLGVRDFKSALWTEGVPSLEDRARAAIERLIASTGVGAHSPSLELRRGIRQPRAFLNDAPTRSRVEQARERDRLGTGRKRPSTTLRISQL
jgi:hypothetical protein